MATATALEKAYFALHKKQPNSEDIYRIRQGLDVSKIDENDSAARLFVYFDYILEGIKSVPVDFHKNYDLGIRAYEARIAARADEIAQDTETRVIDTVERLAERSARAVSTRVLCMWLVGTILVATLAVSGMAYVLFEKSFNMGFAAGETSVQARSDWAETPDGRAAFRLAKSGQFRMLAECSGPGWRIVEQDGGRVCLPERSKDGLQGWYMP